MTASKLEKWLLRGGVSLAGLLLGFLGNFLWARVDAHEGRITRNETKIDGLTDIARDTKEDTKEIRQGMVEIRDAVRRLEGARDVSSNRR